MPVNSGLEEDQPQNSSARKTPEENRNSPGRLVVIRRLEKEFHGELQNSRIARVDDFPVVGISENRYRVAHSRKPIDGLCRAGIHAIEDVKRFGPEFEPALHFG